MRRDGGSVLPRHAIGLAIPLQNANTDGALCFGQGEVAILYAPEKLRLQRRWALRPFAPLMHISRIVEEQLDAFKFLHHPVAVLRLAQPHEVLPKLDQTRPLNIDHPGETAR